MRKYRLDLATQGNRKVPCLVPDDNDEAAVYAASEVDEFMAAVGANTQLLHNRIAELEKALEDMTYQRDSTYAELVHLQNR